MSTRRHPLPTHSQPLDYVRARERLAPPARPLPGGPICRALLAALASLAGLIQWAIA